MDLRTIYMGLALHSPLIASASPLTGELKNLRALEDGGAGAVVLPSMFAEQIEAEDMRHDRLSAVGQLSSPEATGYFPPHHLNSSAADRHLELIRSARAALSIPVIASLNAVGLEGWTGYASQMEQAGAQALELNIYFVANDLRVSGAEIERRYVEVVRAVRREVRIPLAVKLSPYFSSTGHLAVQLAEAEVGGLVLFNRFYQPDIDPVGLKVVNDLAWSQSADMRLPLFWLAALHGRLKPSLGATSGVHTVLDVVKYLLAGADVVMTTSALLQHGAGHMKILVDGLAAWLEGRGFESANDVRGLLSNHRTSGGESSARSNYIRILQNSTSEKRGVPDAGW